MEATARAYHPHPTLTLVDPHPAPHLYAIERELAQLPPPAPEPVITHPGCDPLPHRVIGKLAVIAYEVIDGSRHISQLGVWFTRESTARLREYRALNVERRSLHSDTRRAVPTVHRVHVNSPKTGILEATVTLHTPGRMLATALRLEAHRGRWRATSVDVLH